MFQFQAKAYAVAEPILAEVAATEEGPEGEGGNVVPPSGEDGRGAADQAPAPEDQTMCNIPIFITKIKLILRLNRQCKII